MAGRALRRLAATSKQLLSESSSAAPVAEPRQLRAAATKESIVHSLDEFGYCIIPDYLSPQKVAALRADLESHLAETPTGRNSFEGGSTRRIYAIFAKTRGFDDVATDPLLLSVVEEVLGGPHIQLSSPTGIDIGPGEVAQMLHRDDGKYPIPRPHQEVVVNMMVALDDFTEENGATVLLPRSHLAKTDGWCGAEDESNTVVAEASRHQRRGQQQVLSKRSTAVKNKDAVADSSNLIQAVMPAGGIVIYRGSLLHGGGEHRGARPRLGVIVEFCSSWLRPQENHILAVPRSVVRELPERLQELLGYNMAPPFIGYVDGRHPRKSLQKDFI